MGVLGIVRLGQLRELLYFTTCGEFSISSTRRQMQCTFGVKDRRKLLELHPALCHFVLQEDFGCWVHVELVLDQSLAIYQWHSLSLTVS